MNKTGIIAVAAAALAASAGAASAQTSLPFSITGVTLASNNQTAVTADTVPAGSSYNWTVNLSSTATRIQGNIGFGIVPMTLIQLGISPTELIGAGVAFGPGTLFNKTFAVGSNLSYTVKVDLLADRRIQTMVTGNTLGTLPVGTAGSPTPIQVVSVEAGGTATVTSVPAPGPVALMGAGGMLLVRRKRRPA